MATATKAKKKTVRLASGRKRARQDVTLNAHNTALRSRFRTVIKNVQKAVASGDKAKATELYKSAQSVIDSVADKASSTRTRRRATRAASPPSSRACPPERSRLKPRACIAGPCRLWARAQARSCGETSLVRRWLSRAKFITKSSAIGSMPRSASLTITHFTPSTTRGTQ